jgi:hypothetical protein
MRNRYAIPARRSCRLAAGRDQLSAILVLAQLFIIGRIGHRGRLNNLPLMCSAIISVSQQQEKRPHMQGTPCQHHHHQALSQGGEA